MSRSYGTFNQLPASLKVTATKGCTTRAFAQTIQRNLKMKAGSIILSPGSSSKIYKCFLLHNSPITYLEDWLIETIFNTVTMNKVIYIMGVAGSGKTTVGELLAAKTGVSFYDADDFHSQQNKEKMKAGIPLTDEDRWPWLASIHSFIQSAIKDRSVIVACSALKAVYRNLLDEGIESSCNWVFLKGDFTTIQERIQNRKGHYMPAALLQSQFDTLELPANALVVDIALSPDQITSEIIKQFNDSFFEDYS